MTITFENFGFRGKTTAADTVKKARQRLDECARDGNTFDLVITDMHLPDGTGLEVVRHVRSSLSGRYTPVLILSGDVDPKRVGRAYALGANAYIDKSPSGRSLSDVLRSLYEHWARDAALPRVHEPNPFQQVIARSLDLRARHALLYQNLAENFADSPSESAFWLSRSLAESNMTNLLAFMQRILAGHDEPDDVLAEIEKMQGDIERALSVAERELERRPIVRLDAYRLVVDLLSMMNLDALSRSINNLYPLMPVAMDALRDFLIGAIHDVTAWIDLHTDDPVLRQRTARLLAESAALTEQASTPVAPVEHAQPTLQ